MPPDWIRERILGHDTNDADRNPDVSQSLDDRLSAVEVLQEGLGRRNELTINLNDYITDLRKELQSIRRIRLFAIVASSLFIIYINFALVFLQDRSLLKLLVEGQYFQSASLIATITASVVGI